MRTAVYIGAVLVVCCVMTFGDTLRLNDGKEVVGTLRRGENGWEVTDANGKATFVPEDQIASIEMGKPNRDSATDAQSRLATVRRLADGQSDPAVAIARYDKLIVELGDGPATDTARKDLETWKQRQTGGMVKLGGKWLDRDAIAKVDERSLARIEQAKGLVKLAQFKEATGVLDSVLAEDPANVGALYLRGLVLSRTAQPGVTRKAFEQVIAIMPDHGPTLNNLAVMQWRQRQFPAAMVNYERALAALPDNQILLDNLAEVLNDLPRDIQTNLTTKRVRRRFEEQEPRLEAQLTQTGWYRWGSTWVNADQLQQIKAEEAAIKDKLALLSRDFDDTQAQIDRIDADSQANTRALNNMEASRYMQDAKGNPIRMPLTDRYYQTQGDQVRLDGERKRNAQRLDAIRREADGVKAKISVPAFKGVLRLMDEKQTPAGPRSGKGAATQPATAPTAFPATLPATLPAAGPAAAATLLPSAFPAAAATADSATLPPIFAAVAATTEPAKR